MKNSNEKYRKAGRKEGLKNRMKNSNEKGIGMQEDKKDSKTRRYV